MVGWGGGGMLGFVYKWICLKVKLIYFDHTIGPKLHKNGK